MTLTATVSRSRISRRRFLAAGAFGIASLGLYSGEIERHWAEVSHRDVHLPNLPPAFEGARIAQLSDIHMEEFTEPFYLRQVVNQVSRLKPDFVFLTGDFVSHGPFSKDVSVRAAGECAGILEELQCSQVYAVLGNHDALVGEELVTQALTASHIPVLRNSHVALERGGGRLWLAGVDDPLCGSPDPEAAIPASIRNIPTEPVILLCHGPDFADNLLARPVGQSVSLMLSGHTHGGQVRLPLVGAVALPPMGQKYVEGWFRLGGLQLYVNRGIGTVQLPFRFNCPPEITLFTLRKA